MSTDLLPVNIKRILYATDLSENARHAMAYAVSLANLYCAQIIILHVIDATPDFVDAHVIGYISATEWEDIKKRNISETRDVLIGKKRDNTMIHEVLDRFCQNLRPGSNDHVAAMDETVIKTGNPVVQILATAEEKRCDLIVMGTHGRGDLVDTMMGSTSSRVIRRSNIPVLSVRLPQADDS
ncbi:MAG: universal stress protein [Desulfobacterales bacterium]|jgi:nucleotide-binding universal stress UspA family protein